MSRSALNQLEQLLNQNAQRLCEETGQRYLQLPTLKKSDISDDATVRIGAQHVHELVIVVVVLYPSDITLRQQFEWASTGLLDRRQVGYEQLGDLIHTYFAVARDILGSNFIADLDLLEIFMSRILTEVFLGPADS